MSGNLDLFSDKARARTAADLPVLREANHAVTLEGARAFFASLRGGPMIIKAVASRGAGVQRSAPLPEDHRDRAGA